MSKTCKNCGEEIKDTARTCPKCGKPADPPEQPYLNRKVKKTPWIDGTEPEPKPKKKAHAGIIIAAVLVIAVAAAGIYWFVLRDEKNAADDGVNPTETATAAVTDDTPDPELKKLADEGRISSKITAVDSNIMKSMIEGAQTLEYTEMSEQDFVRRVNDAAGIAITASTDSTLIALTAENDRFIFDDACDDENEAYLVFDKNEKTMFIFVRPIGSDGYWKCERVAAENIPARYNGEEQNNVEVHYVLGSTGETVFSGKTVDEIWCFYYNDVGELFLCMNNADISNPKFFNGDFLSMDSFAGKLVQQTVFDNIKTEYGKELVVF